MIIRAFILLACGLFLGWAAALKQGHNPARRKCQHQPGAACTCAGVRGEYVYGCECCAASPCRPQADLDLDKILKAERAAARAEHRNEQTQHAEHP